MSEPHGVRAGRSIVVSRSAQVPFGRLIQVRASTGAARLIHDVDQARWPGPGVRSGVGLREAGASLQAEPRRC